MKKAITTTLGLMCMVSIMLAGAERQDGSCDLLWTLGFLAFAVLCGWAWNKLNKKNPSSHV